MTGGWDRRGVLAGLAAMPAIARAGAIASGPVQPSWASLAQAYRAPDWFRDAKFGIWSHWGPQAVPEQGDWYGRLLYVQGHPMYRHHLATYGHPSETGMLALIGRWTAEAWQPEALMKRYVAAGAKYFVSLACHHDNFDCYPSRYHPWNATRVGPRRDVVGTWARAARAAGLRFGVSNHASHAWHWYQPAYGYDAEGPRAGQRYDAYRLTAAHGHGRWWQGLDPQLLYTGRHMVAPAGLRTIAAMDAWHDAHDGRWIETVPPSDAAYVRRWLLRQLDLVARYDPDLVYFDNTELPFGPVGRAAVADLYNRSIVAHGRLEAVATGKLLSPVAEAAITADVEKGFSDRLRDRPWQTDTCLGDWFYNRDRFAQRTYKTAEDVLQRLADVISKNGNLLLSVPQRGDGTIDAEEERVLGGLAAWMRVNGEAVFGSRPWRVFGEGPTKLQAGMKNEDAFAGFDERDVRFTTRGGALHVFFLKPPTRPARIAALGRGRQPGTIARATLLGGAQVRFRQEDDALVLDVPRTPGPVPVVRLDGNGLVDPR